MRSLIVATAAASTLALVASLPAIGPAAATNASGTGSIVGGSEASRTAPQAARRAKVPGLRITTKVDGLSHPWDVRELGDGDLLITERSPARLTLAHPGGAKRRIAFPSDKVYVEGETGLLGLEIDPGIARNGRFYTCSGWNRGGGHDIRVNAWKLNDARTRARLLKPLVTGLPSRTGRHGGCRLLITTSGALVVGTGDAAVGTNPRNKSSLGGKTLRLDRRTGKPDPHNPFIRSKNRKRRYVLTYGHRNVQGLAQRADGTLWSVEHGPDVNDEVNKLKAGGDYGWNPVPGYNESVPMTDQGLPGKQISARWRSGNPTLATSGSTFVYGDKWGAYDGALAVAVLKSERVLFLRFDNQGRHPRVYTPGALRRYGRLRTVTQMGNGNLLVATDGDSGAGKILLVRPRP